MRTLLWPAAVVLVFPVAGFCQQQNPPDQPPPQAAQHQPAQKDSLADAARRAREQKKDQKASKVFDNDNLPGKGGVSVVGEGSPAPSGDANAPVTATPPPAGAKPGPNDEKSWRDKFAKLRNKLAQDQAELDVMQREWGVLDLQYYNDPVKAMQQGLTRADINDKTAKIEAKKKEIEADQQAISDAEDELRKSGGDIGWSR